MARRIARAGLEVVAWDRAAGARAGIAGEERVQVVETLPALVAALPAPRVVWLMLPAGAPTEATLAELRELLAPGDVDRGRRERLVSRQHAAGRASSTPLGLQFVDAGVSGGVWGLVNGYGLMVGGSVRGGGARRALPARAGARSGARAGCTAARAARGTSPRWCITASSTA